MHFLSDVNINILNILSVMQDHNIYCKYCQIKNLMKTVIKQTNGMAIATGQLAANPSP